MNCSVKIVLQKKLLLSISLVCACSFKPLNTPAWQSSFVQANKDGLLRYVPDAKGNILPDFSRVGYEEGDKKIPDVPVVKTVSPTGSDNDEATIQAAIDEVSEMPLKKNGFRGAVLLKKGVYKIPGSIRIETSGIVLRGEGDDIKGTRLVATAKKQIALINVSGSGTITEIKNTRVDITDEYVPVGSVSFAVSSKAAFAKGDKIIVFRPGTKQWIKDLKMDQIETHPGTKQWQPKEYDLRFERIVTGTDGNKIFIDNPVVMAMETKYGGGEIYKYSFEGRISHVGIENLYCESEFETDTSENHAWDAIAFNKIEQGWVKQVTAKYFGYSCVNLGSYAKHISVLNSNCFDSKSLITGGRRYSFCNNGQLNLFMNCHTTEGRHDFVTGARVCGPNVFYNCTAQKTHADIGPHHRWASGTLYDNIQTDGDINVQDRGNWGSGHGWAGVTQVVWNCTVRKAAVQNPWVSGKNYCIGLIGEKYEGRFKGRTDAEWEGLNKEGLEPASLYKAQLKARSNAPIKSTPY